ncbi:hypothetical protein [Burkholderia sp. Bp9142]|uniref:hypothetical protein n=1 Tax=Burkholderia sp. Bp9142 TaxID=2184573 RepID=UPI000F5ACB09|nr:hypothetical protein [Burkholderia sp. Bp9142]
MIKRLLCGAFLILIGCTCVASPLHARKVVLNNGVKVDLPIYENKRIDSDGSVCVDVSRLRVTATICLHGKSTDDVVWNNGFIKYRNLPAEGLRRVPLLPDDAFVYVEGGYNVLYPARKKMIGDFVTYDADNVLCKVDSNDGERPAICYAAALVSVKSPGENPVIFVSAIIEQPPTPGGRLSEKAENKVRAINAIIKSIKLMGN